MSLEWHKDNAVGPMGWEEAIEYCKNLGDRWRLPNIKELISLINFDKFEPASSTNMLPFNYWSSTTYACYPFTAWYVYFYDGYVRAQYKSYKLYVRAVRGSQVESGKL